MSAVLSTATDSNSSFARRSDTMISVALLAVIVVLLIPLPSAILDMLLALNLAFSILLLLVTLGAKQALEISVFPSMLLLLTLYRLSLNVATTRLILLQGDAGKIVSTFGGFVVGGSLVVGIVIFLILVIIQFVVITKGASRISEVNARFVLDAMPGKQMAIEAEVTSGAINDIQARQKRGELAREAEFYGAMDGASKYVRGDAVAGLIITLVNIVGGVVLGMMNGLGFSESMQLYSTLTIGDGLLSQIPALIIATTAGILVTKASTGSRLGHELGMQMLSRRKPLIVAGGIMLTIALTPGLPKLPFIVLGVGLILFARRFEDEPEQVVADVEPEPEPPRSREETGLDEFVNSDRVSLEIGTSLIPLASRPGSKALPERIASMRRDLTRKFGLWIPTVRLRDSMQLDADSYRILINGRECGKGSLRVGYCLAIDPGNGSLPVDGEETTEPAFGLPAKWIPATARQRAELSGNTVVDAVTVLITHLGEVLRRHAHELLGREDMQKMLNKVRDTAPTIVDELKPEVVRPAVLRRVLTNLLAEKVPISSLELILESVVHHGVQNKDPDLLTERVREDIGNIVCERFRNEQGNITVIVIDPHLESQLREAMSEGRIVLPARILEKLVGQLRQQWEPLQMKDRDVAVLTDNSLRRPLRRLIERALPDLACIAYTEIPGSMMIDPVSIIRLATVYGPHELAASAAPQPPATDSIKDSSPAIKKDAA